MRMTTLTLLPILVIAVSCGGSSSPEATAVVQTSSGPVVGKSAPSNDDIIAKAYDPDYAAPADFFVDERTATETGSFTIHHVLDTSRSYEVCSNDMTEATAWEDADNASRAVSGPLVAIHETDRYFEFVRELTYDDDVGNVGDPTSPGYARIFKCNHTNRSGVDRNLLDGYSGVRNAQPLTAAELRDFTEYLWQFRFFNVKHKVVIDSYGESTPGNTVHTLLLALVHSQGPENCDRVELVEWQFSADEQTREVSRTFQVVRDFEAQVAGGVPSICG
ncbi:MAG: hypothetical protein AAFN50_13230 [Pseudomonadota bacterium]